MSPISRKTLAMMIAAIIIVAAVVVGAWYYLFRKPPKVELVFYSWGGTFQEKLSAVGLKAFEEEYGIKVVEGSFGTSDEIIAKIKASPGEIDVIESDDYGVYKGIKEGVLEPINMSNVPNYENLIPKLREMIGWKDGKCYGIAGCVYGTTALVYNTEHVPEEDMGVPPSWAVMWNPEYDGKVSVEDWVYDRVSITALYLGQDPYKVFRECDIDIDPVWDALSEQRDLITSYWEAASDMETYLTTEEAWLGDFWGGRAYYVKQQGVPVEYVFPDEGCPAWSDCLSIPKDAPHKYEAELLINFLLGVDMQIELSKELGYPPVIDADYISAADLEAISQWPDFDPTGTLERAWWYNFTAWVANEEEWTEAWESIKAG